MSKKAQKIEKVAVIGSGVMGSGIAAQIANAGVPVVLLDIVPKDAEDRSALAKGAIQKMLKTSPAPFMHKGAAKLITPGNLEDDLGLLKECDWIVEVVLEKLEIKHATYQKINKHRKKGSIVSSNTSTIPLAKLIEGQSDDFVKDFMITHFFNPPRYLRLLELIKGEKTRQDAVETITEFCDIRLGKGVVDCKDTPGFITNRLLVYCLTNAINIAVQDKVSIEVADAVMSKPVGIPKTGVFGLLDLIGIDLMPYLSESLLKILPEGDKYRDIYIDHPCIHQMIEAGYTGRKGKGGFYRLDPEAKGKKVKQVLQLANLTPPTQLRLGAESTNPSHPSPPRGEGQGGGAASFNPDKAYEALEKPRLASVEAGKKGLRAVVETDDEGGRYAWKVLAPFLAYAASLVPEIADTVKDVDDAMRMGCNWKNGPFEMMDALGPAWLAEKLEKEGIEVPELLKKIGDGTFYKVEDGKLHFFGTDGKYHEVVRPEGVLLLHDIKLMHQEPVKKNGSAALWDIGDGVLCFEHTAKMNTFDDQVFELLNFAIKTIGDGKGDYKALVIYNEASHFSAGANLGLALFAINIALWPQMDQFIEAGQSTFKKLKFAPFPVIAAPSGMALGGGCEILLHADHIQAHAETYCGLVEVGVGVIPGWGGCKEMILRFQERERAQHDKATGGKQLWFSPKNSPMGAVRKAFETIGMASVAKSAHEAKQIGYFRDSDGITMNRDRLLYDAKEKALALAKNYTAPEPVEDIRLPGKTGKAALDLAVGDLQKSGKATPYDGVVSDALGKVLSGGEKSDWTQTLKEDDLLALEKEQFMTLVRNEGTMDRIEHMLDTGKPLRN